MSPNDFIAANPLITAILVVCLTWLIKTILDAWQNPPTHYRHPFNRPYAEDRHLELALVQVQHFDLLKTRCIFGSLILELGPKNIVDLGKVVEWQRMEGGFKLDDVKKDLRIDAIMCRVDDGYKLGLEDKLILNIVQNQLTLVHHSLNSIKALGLLSHDSRFYLAYAAFHYFLSRLCCFSLLGVLSCAGK
jgi:hypothetical protein